MRTPMVVTWEKEFLRFLEKYNFIEVGINSCNLAQVLKKARESVPTMFAIEKESLVKATFDDNQLLLSIFQPKKYTGHSQKENYLKAIQIVDNSKYQLSKCE